jgi:hypothetical protein
MQEYHDEGVSILCDFCHTAWDGEAAMVEGHHGSVICLDCLKKALNEAATHGDKYQCTLCLRINIPGSLPRWSTAEYPQAIVCQECLFQAAKAMSKAPHANFSPDYSRSSRQC